MAIGKKLIRLIYELKNKLTHWIAFCNYTKDIGKIKNENIDFDFDFDTKEIHADTIDLRYFLSAK